MFRKPKPKNIRQRVREGDDEVTINTTKASLSDENTENLEETELQLAKPKTILSFNQNEDDDVVEFKIKKASHHTATEKSLRKSKKMAISATTKKITIKEEIVEEDVIILDNSAVTIKTEEIHKTIVDERKFQIPDKQMAMESDVQKRFPTSFTKIPDAKAVYEARKKREQMRKDGHTVDAEFIPLDDTIRLKNSSDKRSGERSRLIREDDNDMSDEDHDVIESGGKFYSAKNLLITEEENRRTEQINFLRMEQGDSDEEDILEVKDENDDEEDELVRWEKEQIRKGINKLQQELNATSIYYTGKEYNPTNGNGEIFDVQEMDIDVEIVENIPNKLNTLQSDGSLPGSSLFDINDIKSRIRSKIDKKRNFINTTEENLKKLKQNLEDNRISIQQFDSNQIKMQQKYRFFQEIRQFVRDLLESEKTSMIFADTSEEFYDIGKILHRFMDWILIDQRSYEEAYVELCVPKLLAPFIRLEMQERILFTQSQNLNKVLLSLINDYPTVNAKSLHPILNALYDKAKESIQAGLFSPLL